MAVQVDDILSWRAGDVALGTGRDELLQGLPTYLGVQILETFSRVLHTHTSFMPPVAASDLVGASSVPGGDPRRRTVSWPAELYRERLLSASHWRRHPGYGIIRPASSGQAVWPVPELGRDRTPLLCRSLSHDL